jgi:hypothetical protein
MQQLVVDEDNCSYSSSPFSLSAQSPNELSAQSPYGEAQRESSLQIALLSSELARVQEVNDVNYVKCWLIHITYFPIPHFPITYCLTIQSFYFIFSRS